MTVCLRKVDGILHPSSTAIPPESIASYPMASSQYFVILMRHVLQQHHYITFTLCINQFLLLNSFSFLFVHTSFIINSVSLSFELFGSCIALYLLSLFILFGSFCFLCFFKLQSVLHSTPTRQKTFCVLTVTMICSTLTSS